MKENCIKADRSNYISIAVLFFFSENGFKNVRFHIDANLHHFSFEDETKMKETVANIVGCSIEDVRVNGYIRSTSFFYSFIDQRNLH